MKKIFLLTICCCLYFQIYSQQIDTLRNLIVEYKGDDIKKANEILEIELYNEIFSKVGSLITKKVNVITSDKQENKSDSFKRVYNEEIKVEAKQYIRILKKQVLQPEVNNIQWVVDVEIETQKLQSLLGESMLPPNCTKDLSYWGKLNTDGKGKFIIVNDKEKGKVIEISRKELKKEQLTFLQKDFSKLAGRTVILKSQIKVENVSNEDWHGQLCIKYTVDNKIYYNCVQGLVGNRDWDEFYAQKDNSSATEIDIPTNAKDILLYFGLQGDSGIIYFKDMELIVEY